CSSASLKFRNRSDAKNWKVQTKLSVLFCEPKIPKLTTSTGLVAISLDFQCSSASRKFRTARVAPDGTFPKIAYSALPRA
ncbi:MAG: hypothetical protein RMJ55_20530, partial [Roseiflexaceae bacterium]|nr:hypothetical protein [Roseiflexaceae bacterium]